MQSFDLENFRIEFTKTIETPESPLCALEIMVDALQENPDMLKEIAEVASTALRTVAAKKNP